MRQADDIGDSSIGARNLYGRLGFKALKEVVVEEMNERLGRDDDLAEKTYVSSFMMRHIGGQLQGRRR